MESPLKANSDTLDEMIRSRKVFPIPTNEDRARHINNEIDIFNSPNFIYQGQTEKDWEYWHRIYEFYEAHNLKYNDLDQNLQSVILGCLYTRCKVERHCYAIEKDLLRYLRKEIAFEQIRDKFGEMEDLLKGISIDIKLADFIIGNDRYNNPVYDEEKLNALRDK